MIINAAQVRAARGMIAWSQRDLARAANVGVSTVADFERGARAPIANNLAAIQRALEVAGIVFIDGDEPGVKLKRQRRS
jgi:transcriptional regulator with XRE-family HTH domain